MPWTFAHPAAVLPLRPLCPRWLSWPGLILGAMAPDLSHYIGMHGPLRAYLHTPEGVLTVCLPVCLLLLALLLRFSKPLTVLLRDPHRTLVRQALQPPPQAAGRAWAVTVLSILIGAATHLAWDAFTHTGPLTDELLPWLDDPLITAPGHRPLLVAQVLQHLSTVLGAAVLLLAYRNARHRLDPTPPPPLDRQRRRLLWACFGVAVVVGALSSWALTPAAMPAYRSHLLVRSVTWSTSCGATLYVIASLLWWRQRGDA
ncbi:DUF4184 family protein [Roseateles cellulosilyticus]|uniref:DUF4184 family protein n=1 Tax=Pelomonas cellulosilytica TaxID=2906762 RepID=A0ABS8XLP5_9BURK|nr:DUF4184 family protein [Pelomonas sp. P8]MCE4553719.1 DUF4184 family protein [Pelomonas sp. P8]